MGNASNTCVLGAITSLGLDEIIALRLYVAGQTPKSVAALANLKRVCEAW